MDLNHQLAKRIRRALRIRKIIIICCIATLVSGVSSFLFYGIGTTNNAIKFISQKSKINNVEKIMTNPRIKFDNNGQIIDIEAKKAVHKNKEDVQLLEVEASGPQRNIKAGSLLISNDGNDLHFSGNPILTIKETRKNEQ